MSEQSAERMIYQGGDITITTTQVTIKGHTTLTENIKSVETGKNTKRGSAPITLGLFSIIARSAGIHFFQTDVFGWFLLIAGLISLTAAIYLAFLTKAEYNLKITTTSGEIQMINSADKDFVDTITKSIETAVLEQRIS